MKGFEHSPLEPAFEESECCVTVFTHCFGDQLDWILVWELAAEEASSYEVLKAVMVDFDLVVQGVEDHCLKNCTMLTH